jgi:hypothetical protein
LARTKGPSLRFLISFLNRLRKASEPSGSQHFRLRESRWLQHTKRWQVNLGMDKNRPLAAIGGRSSIPQDLFLLTGAIIFRYEEIDR